MAATLEAMLARLPPCPSQRLAVPEAIGAVLCEAALAPVSLPAQPVALRDGWAVLAAETVGATSYGPGILSRPPVRVAAGQPLPAGADAVLPPAAIDWDGGAPACSEAAARFANVRRAGSDIGAGDVLAPAGATLTPARAAACQAAGVDAVSVGRPLVAFAPDLDASSKAVAAALIGQHAIASEGDEASILLAPWRPLEAGALDVVCEALALAPGEATWIRMAGDKAVLHLPAGFAPAVAVTLALLRPLLATLAGGRPEAPTRTLPLARKIASRIGWSELVLLGVEDERWTPLMVGDATVSALARAAAWTLVPPDSEGAPAGAMLAVNPLGDVP